MLVDDKPPLFLGSHPDRPAELHLVAVAVDGIDVGILTAEADTDALAAVGVFLACILLQAAREPVALGDENPDHVSPDAPIDFGFRHRRHLLQKRFELSGVVGLLEWLGVPTPPPCKSQHPLDQPICIGQFGPGEGLADEHRGLEFDLGEPGRVGR